MYRSLFQVLMVVPSLVNCIEVDWSRKKIMFRSQKSLRENKLRATLCATAEGTKTRAYGGPQAHKLSSMRTYRYCTLHTFVHTDFVDFHFPCQHPLLPNFGYHPNSARPPTTWQWRSAHRYDLTIGMVWASESLKVHPSVCTEQLENLEFSCDFHVLFILTSLVAFVLYPNYQLHLRDTAPSEVITGRSINSLTRKEFIRNNNTSPNM